MSGAAYFVAPLRGAPQYEDDFCCQTRDNLILRRRAKRGHEGRSGADAGCVTRK
jgi:hypothetical protein